MPDDELTRLLTGAIAPVELHELPPLDGIVRRGRQRNRRRTALLGVAALAVVGSGTLLAGSITHSAHRGPDATIVGTPVPTATPSDPSPAVVTSSVPTALPSPPLAHGRQGTRAQVPWDQVGPGWTLALWSKAVGVGPGEQPPAGTPAYDKTPHDLFLVDPVGGRYLITTLPAGSTARLSSWSGDGHRALFQQTDLGQHDSAIYTAKLLDLMTGAMTPIAGNPLEISFTQPTGLGLLRTDAQHVGSRISRTGLDGSNPVVLASGRDVGRATYSPDGTKLLLSRGAGYQLIDNEGHALPLTTPLHSKACDFVGWLDDTRLQTSCNGGASAWSVSITGEPDELVATVPSASDPHVLGVGQLYPLGSETFVQTFGGCGAAYLGQLGTGSVAHEVVVPGAKDSVFVIGTQGHDRLPCRPPSRAAVGSPS